MKYFAKVGESGVVIDSTKNPQCPDGYIEMLGDRPSPNAIAKDDGTWEEIDNSKAEREAEIYARLDEIDLASLRPLRAVYNKTATDFDKKKLKDLEAEANSLREELAELKKPKIEVSEEVANAE